MADDKLYTFQLLLLQRGAEKQRNSENTKLLRKNVICDVPQMPPPLRYGTSNSATIFVRLLSSVSMPAPSIGGGVGVILSLHMNMTYDNIVHFRMMHALRVTVYCVCVCEALAYAPLRSNNFQIEMNEKDEQKC